jgi:hypothetical protein
MYEAFNQKVTIRIILQRTNLGKLLPQICSIAHINGVAMQDEIGYGKPDSEQVLNTVRYIFRSVNGACSELP